MLRALYALVHSSCSQETYHLVEKARYWQSEHAECVVWTTVWEESEKESLALLFLIRSAESKCPEGWFASLVACWFVILYSTIIIDMSILRGQEQVLPIPNIQQIVISISSLPQAVPLLYVLYTEVLYRCLLRKAAATP